MGSKLGRTIGAASLTIAVAVAVVLGASGASSATGRVRPASSSLVVSVTADSPTVPPGGTDGYTISVSNPYTFSVLLTTVTDELPAGFSYQADSATGATTENPSIVGQTLTWDGRCECDTDFNVPAGGSISFHFNVTATTTPGTYYDSADATTDDEVSITPSGRTARIRVCTSPVVTTQPQDVAIFEGHVATFDASATSVPAPTVQWQVSTDGGASWNDLPGETSTTLSFTPAGVDTGNLYRAVFTCLCGSTPTRAALLTVHHDTSGTTSTGTTTSASTSTTAHTTTTTATTTPPPLSPPVFGKTANVHLDTGTACFYLPGVALTPGNCQPITGETQIPIGSVIDATHGQVTVTTAEGKGSFFAGLFLLGETLTTQASTGLGVPAGTPYTTIQLKGGNPGICAISKTNGWRGATLGATPPKPKPKVIRRIFGKVNGHFQTRGNYAAGTVRGTYWLTEDLCDPNGTLVHVFEGVVDVRDYRLAKTITLKAGGTYYAKAKVAVTPVKKP